MENMKPDVVITIVAQILWMGVGIYLLVVMMRRWKWDEIDRKSQLAHQKEHHDKWMEYLEQAKRRLKDPDEDAPWKRP